MLHFEKEMVKVCRGLSEMGLFLIFASLVSVSVETVTATSKTSTGSQSIIKSQEIFGAKFYKEFTSVVGRQTNTVVSPLSVYMVLAMLREGAAENSRFQIEQAMAFSNVKEFGVVLRKFAGLLFRENETVSMMNKIWQQEFFCITQCRKFTKELQRNFYADLGEVNFVVEPKKAARLINRWVNHSSRGRIEKLVKENEVTRNTRFVLTNMIYFQAKWKEMFRETETVERYFTVLDGGAMKRKYVETMFTHAMFRYTDGYGEGFRLLELPYRNEHFAMIIILPLSTNNINEIEKSLNFTALNDLIENLQRRPKFSIDVHMPKFCVSTGIGLNGALKSMGLTDIFDPSMADLSNLSGFKGMYVSSARHEAYISVTEQGTEAVGGSSVTSGDLSLSYEFRVNKSFLFLIRHSLTGSTLFMGRVLDPSIKSCDTQ